jgi:hypothetical protein
MYYVHYDGPWPAQKGKEREGRKELVGVSKTIKVARGEVVAE